MPRATSLIVLSLLSAPVLLAPRAAAGEPTPDVAVQPSDAPTPDADAPPSDAEPLVSDDPLVSDEPKPWEFVGLALYWDNDGAYAKPWDSSDRHYTNGAKLDFAWALPEPPASLDELLRPAGTGFEDARLAVGFVLAQHIYTATDIRDRNPPRDDHPYSGWLYGGLYFQRAGEHVHDHVELDLGVAGRGSMAESAQQFVHSVVPDQDKPRGWSTQLSSEFALNVRLARTWRTPTADLFGLELQALPRVSADLGNVFLRARGDVTVRLGLNLPDDFGPGRLLDFRDATGRWGGDDAGFYLFARAGGGLVGRDLFIEGNTFQNSRGASLTPLVGELEFGVHVRWRSIEAGYSVTWLTEQFKAQDHPDAFGSWQLTFHF